MTLNYVGVDLAKNVYQVHSVDWVWAYLQMPAADGGTIDESRTFATG